AGRHEVAEDTEQEVEQARAAREKSRGQVGKTTVADDDLEGVRDALLVARRQTPRAVVASQGARRHVAAAERLHGSVGGHFGAPEAVEDPLTRERIEEAGGVAHHEHAAGPRTVDAT